MTKLLIHFRYIAFLLVLAAGYAEAQSTTVSGTVVDPNGYTWSYGTVTALFRGAPNYNGHSIWSGGTLNTIPATVSTDSGGNFSITLPSNTSITPSGSTWQLNFCPNETLQCAVIVVSVTGTTYNPVPAITTQNAWPTSQIGPTQISKVYNTAQVGTPPINQGGMVYNTTNQTMYVYGTSGWTPFAFVGGLPVITNPSGNQTVTQPINTIFNFITSGTGAVEVNGYPVVTTNSDHSVLSTISSNGVGTIAFGNPFTAPTINNIQYPVPASGDIGAPINAAFAQYTGGTISNTTTSAEVDLQPNTVYQLSTEIVIPSNQTSPYIYYSVLDCRGATLVWNGSGPAINVKSENAGGLTGAIRNCRILNGSSNTTSTWAIYAPSRMGFTYGDHLDIEGFSNAGGGGIFLDNVSETSATPSWPGYSEQNRFIDDFLVNNTTNIEFLGSDGGTNSFARTMMRGVVMGIGLSGGTQNGFLVDGSGATQSAYLYNSNIEIRGNMLGSTTSAVKVENGGQIETGIINLGFENTASPGSSYLIYVADTASSIGNEMGITDGSTSPNFLCATCTSDQIQLFNPESGGFIMQQLQGQNGVAQARNSKFLLNYGTTGADGALRYGIASYSGAESNDGYRQDFTRTTTTSSAADSEVDSTTTGASQVNLDLCMKTGCGFGPGYGYGSTIGGATLPTHPLEYTTIGTQAICNSAASPAVCGAAPTGAVAIPVGGASVTVNTTAATTNSTIIIQEDYTLGSRLGVTCNTTTATVTQAPVIAAKANGSFLFGIAAGPTTNPSCFTYTIID